MANAKQRPLEGVRVIEMGQLLAGPFTGTILAYFGAEVIKVEPPGGDPIRGWRLLRNGTSLWYRSLGRNKKSVTLDLKSERGRELAGKLLDTADVVVSAVVGETNAANIVVSVVGGNGCRQRGGIRRCWETEYRQSGDI